MKVSVIVPVYNGRELLERNLPLLIKAGKIKENRISEIILVDDASEDRSVDFVKKNFSQVRLIKHRINRGFSATVNTGVRSARERLVTLLNTDVAPKEDFLAPIFRHFKNPQILGVSLHERGYGWAKGKFEQGFITHSPADESQFPQETFWVSGGSGVFRRDYWVRLGGMDEKLFSPYYWEDVDLSYRALKRGYKLLWEPKAEITHEHEATIKKISKKKRQRIQERNQLLFIWKNLTSPNLFRKHLTGLLRRIVRHPGYIRIVFMALFKLRLVVKARRKEKKGKKVSDEAILAKFAD